MTLDEFLFGEQDVNMNQNVSYDSTSTRTYLVKDEYFDDPRRQKDYVHTSRWIEKLYQFNKTYEKLESIPEEMKRESLYREFYIPKNSGGMRKIDAPEAELDEAHRSLKAIFEQEFGAFYLYHTTAFAYIRKRDALKCVKKHTANQSKWYLKLDFHKFFPSTTIDYLMSQLEKIYPFCFIMKGYILKDGDIVYGKEEFRKALSLCFLDGGLPQGTRMSPMLTNIMMIPFDFELTKSLRATNNNYVNTRYADDLLISSKYDFKFKEVVNIVSKLIEKYNAPFKLNNKKTRYGSTSGSNWNLGVMVNNDGITIGYKKKKDFKNRVYRYAMDKKAHVEWEDGAFSNFDGLYNYYKNVEPEAIDGIIKYYSQKTGIDIYHCMEIDRKGGF